MDHLLFFKHFRRRLAQDNGGFVGVARHSSRDQFQVFHENPSHSRADNIIICEFSMLISSTKSAQVADTCGSRAIRSRTEALNGFGVREVLILLTTTSVPRALNPDLPAFLETPRNTDERHDRGDADGDANERQPGSHWATHQAAHHNGQKMSCQPPVE